MSTVPLTNFFHPDILNSKEVTYRPTIIIISFLVMLSSIQAGADFYPFSPTPLSLGLDSPSTSQINGIVAGLDSPRLPMVAGASTSSDSWFSIFNILKL